MSKTSISVVIPTYCEAENLALLIPQIFSVFREADLRGEIIVVDDNSPDNTREVIAALAQEIDVKLLVRTNERGLSSAVVHGMKRSSGDIIIVMDADLSHPPESIPSLVSNLRTDNYDFVIGSRYVPGGSTDDNWGIFRWLNSRIATLLAYPLTTAKDPMAGFFGLRRETFLQAERLDPIGYKIGLELIVKCGCKSVKEVPIHFRDRVYGQSKLNIKEQLNYLRHLKRLYEFKLGRLAKPMQFVAIGASGAVVDLTMLHFLNYFMGFGVARAVSIASAMIWNFWWNRRLTFSNTRLEPIAGQFIRFCIGCTVGAIISWLVAVYSWKNLEPLLRFPELAAVLGIVCGTIFNFSASYFFAFRKSKPT
jgi:dolichol-phosphate mannosyltransferase